MIPVWLIYVGATAIVTAIGGACASSSSSTSSSGSSSGSSSSGDAEAKLAAERRRIRQARLDALGQATRDDLRDMVVDSLQDIRHQAEAMPGVTIVTADDDPRYQQQFCAALIQSPAESSPELVAYLQGGSGTEPGLEAFQRQLDKRRAEAWQALAADLVALAEQRQQKESAEVAQLEQLMAFWEKQQ